MSDLKLWSVEVSETVLVVAETATKARMLAIREASDLEAGFATQISRIEDVPGDWLGCAPFGENDEILEVEEWIEKFGGEEQ